MKRLDKYEKKLENLRESFKKIKILNDDNNKLEELNNIINECNIIEEFNIEYLKVLKKVNEKDFGNNFNKYKLSLTKEAIIENSLGTKEDKSNAVDRIRELFTQIIVLKICDNNDTKQNDIQKIFKQLRFAKKENYDINFQILPMDNIELYLNIFYQLICANLYERFERYSFFDNYKKNEDQLYDEKITMQIEKLKNDSLEKYSSIPQEVQEQINEKVEHLMSFRIIHNNKFNTYIQELDRFYFEVINDYFKRFRSGIKTEEDVLLYQKYVFFLSSFDFFYLKQIYIHIWKESFFFNHNLEDIKENLLHANKILENEKKKIILDNNDKDIVLQFDKKEFRIENFSQFCFQSMLKYLIDKDFSDLDYLSLIKYVKVQNLDNFMNKRILTEKWKDFYYNVFESKAIKSLIKDTYKYGSDIPINEFRKIIDNVCFYNFDTYFYGETYSFYSIFISAMLNNSGNSNKEKIKYYLIMFLTFLHEILGHTLIIIQRYLFDKTIMSPKTEEAHYSSYAKRRGRESGEYILYQLFGKTLEKFTLGQIYFLFDINSYSLNYEDFKKKFLEYENYSIKNTIKCPDLIKDISENMVIYDIITTDNYYPKSKYENTNIYLFDDINKICNPFALDN